MPNHFHGIVIINGLVQTQSKSTELVQVCLKPTVTNHGLSEIIRTLKTFSAREINKVRNTPGRKFWHKGFYDRIIRNNEEFELIRIYIRNNPLRFNKK